MKHLFSPQGQKALSDLLSLRPLLAFDFDGTLAPIVTRPDDARVSTAVALQLQRLSRWRPVAIVTGRSVEDVTGRLGFNPGYIIGNHGAEDPQSVTDDSFVDALVQTRALLQTHQLALLQAGVTLEDKRSSLALHYRLARDRDAAQHCIAGVLAQLGPEVRTFGGKCVSNIVPAAAPDKGDAVVRLVERSDSDAALIVGDDINDEAVFKIAPHHWVTVRIGRDDTSSAARYFLDSSNEMAILLQRMIDIRDAAAPSSRSL